MTKNEIIAAKTEGVIVTFQYLIGAVLGSCKHTPSLETVEGFIAELCKFKERGYGRGIMVSLYTPKGELVKTIKVIEMNLWLFFLSELKLWYRRYKREREKNDEYPILTGHICLLKKLGLLILLMATLIVTPAASDKLSHYDAVRFW